VLDVEGEAPTTTLLDVFANAREGSCPDMGCSPGQLGLRRGDRRQFRATQCSQRLREPAHGPGGRAWALDAHNAAIYLRTLPDIQPDRIGIIGFSFGGTTTFWASMAEGIPVDRGGRPFQAAVAYYPTCSGGTIVSPFATDVLILIGKDDDWTPADLCIKTVAARANQARPPAIKVYPGAVHSFDRGGLPRPYLGHMVGGNAEAAADSFAMTKAFLDARLKSK
jgi:dienelactone hydrolase